MDEIDGRSVASLGFLSRDPLPGEPGSVWASNPYEYATNDSLLFANSLGLKPLSHEQLQHHNDTDGWFEGNGAWVVGGAMAAVGVVCIATGFGGLLGMALLAGGAETLMQKTTEGTVNYGQVAVSSAFAAVEGRVSTIEGAKFFIHEGMSLGGKAVRRFAIQEVGGTAVSVTQGVVNNVVTGKDGFQNFWANAASGAVGNVFGGMTSGIEGAVDEQVAAELTAGTFSKSDAFLNRVAVRFATSQVDMMGGTAQAGIKDRMTGKETGPADLFAGGKSGVGSWNSLVKNLKNHGPIGRR